MGCVCTSTLKHTHTRNALASQSRFALWAVKSKLYLNFKMIEKSTHFLDVHQQLQKNPELQDTRTVPRSRPVKTIPRLARKNPSFINESPKTPMGCDRGSGLSLFRWYPLLCSSDTGLQVRAELLCCEIVHQTSWDKFVRIKRDSEPPVCQGLSSDDQRRTCGSNAAETEAASDMHWSLDVSLKFCRGTVCDNAKVQVSPACHERVDGFLTHDGNKPERI